MSILLLECFLFINTCLGCNYVQRSSYQDSIPIDVCFGTITSSEMYKCEDGSAYRYYWGGDKPFCDGTQDSKDQVTDNYECGDSSNCEYAKIASYSATGDSSSCSRSDDTPFSIEAYIKDMCIGGKIVSCSSNDVTITTYGAQNECTNEVSNEIISGGCNDDGSIDFEIECDNYAVYAHPIYLTFTILVFIAFSLI